jgi:hypothetical protein
MCTKKKKNLYKSLISFIASSVFLTAMNCVISVTKGAPGIPRGFSGAFLTHGTLKKSNDDGGAELEDDDELEEVDVDAILPKNL